MHPLRRVRRAHVPGCDSRVARRSLPYASHAVTLGRHAVEPVIDLQHERDVRHLRPVPLRRLAQFPGKR